MKNDIKIGDYVVATKWRDGDPRYPYSVGYVEFITREGYYLKDHEGRPLNSLAYQRCKKISTTLGKLLHQSVPILEGKKGKSIWYWVYHPDQLQSLMDSILHPLTQKNIEKKNKKSTDSRLATPTKYFVLRGLTYLNEWRDIERNENVDKVRESLSEYQRNFPSSDPGGWKKFALVERVVTDTEVL